MKSFVKKANLLKSGLVMAVLTIVVLNYSQANGHRKSPSVITITTAKADYTCYSASSTCSGYTSDGVYHTTTNAEN
jgi:hypothetical protein